MGSYISTTTQMLTLFPGLPQTTTSTPAYTSTLAIIEKHVTRAEALINAKIGKRYSVPISPAPPLLSAIAEDICACYIYRSLYTRDNQNRSDYYEQMSEEALKSLDQIHDGNLDLVNTAGSLIEERSTELTTGILASSHQDYTPMFDVDDPLKWDVDSDLLDHIEDARK